MAAARRRSCKRCTVLPAPPLAASNGPATARAAGTRGAARPHAQSQPPAQLSRGSALGADGIHPKPPPTQGGAHGPISIPSGCTFFAGNLPPIELPCAGVAPPTGPAILGIRPEFVALDPASPLRGRVAVDEYLGSSRCLHVDTPVGRLVARVGPDTPGARGAEVGLCLDPSHVRLFDPATGRRLA